MRSRSGLTAKGHGFGKFAGRLRDRREGRSAKSSKPVQMVDQQTHPSLPRGTSRRRRPPSRRSRSFRRIGNPSRGERVGGRDDREGHPGGADRTPGVLAMPEGVDQPGDPHDEEEQEIDERTGPLGGAASAEKADRSPERTGAPKTSAPTMSQAEKLLHCMSALLRLGDAGQKGAGEQRDRESEQDRVERGDGPPAHGRLCRQAHSPPAPPPSNNAPADDWFRGRARNPRAGATFDARRKA